MQIPLDDMNNILEISKVLTDSIVGSESNGEDNLFLLESTIIKRIYSFREEMVFDVLPKEHSILLIKGKEIFEDKAPLEKKIDIPQVRLCCIEYLFKHRYKSYIKHYNNYTREYLLSLEQKQKHNNIIKDYVTKFLQDEFETLEIGINNIKNNRSLNIDLVKNGISEGEYFPKTQDLCVLSNYLSKELVLLRYYLLRILNDIKYFQKNSLFSVNVPSIKSKTKYYVNLCYLGYQLGMINKFLPFEYGLLIKKYKYTHSSYLSF